MKISQSVTGCVFVQVNPFYVYSTQSIIDNAVRLRALFRTVEPAFDESRVCVKVPLTWEGAQACRILEAQGVKTLGTALFTMEQAMIAGEVGCGYIAPYVNELRANIDRKWVFGLVLPISFILPPYCILPDFEQVFKGPRI